MRTNKIITVKNAHVFYPLMENAQLPTIEHLEIDVTNFKLETIMDYFDYKVEVIYSYINFYVVRDIETNEYISGGGVDELSGLNNLLGNIKIFENEKLKNIPTYDIQAMRISIGMKRVE